MERQGVLVYDTETDRMDIRFDEFDYYGGLHCGDCLKVFIRDQWVPTRIEYGSSWYLVGIKVNKLNGLIVRI